MLGTSFASSFGYILELDESSSITQARGLAGAHCAENGTWKHTHHCVVGGFVHRLEREENYEVVSGNNWWLLHLQQKTHGCFGWMSRVGVPPLDTSRFLDLDDRG
jgi:hypothetical protein